MRRYIKKKSLSFNTRRTGAPQRGAPTRSEVFNVGKPKTVRETDVRYDPTGVPVFLTGSRRLYHPDPVKQDMMDSRLVCVYMPGTIVCVWLQRRLSYRRIYSV